MHTNIVGLLCKAGHSNSSQLYTGTVLFTHLSRSNSAHSASIGFLEKCCQDFFSGELSGCVGRLLISDWNCGRSEGALGHRGVSVKWPTGDRQALQDRKEVFLSHVIHLHWSHGLNPDSFILFDIFSRLTCPGEKCENHQLLHLFKTTWRSTSLLFVGVL